MRGFVPNGLLQNPGPLLWPDDEPSRPARDVDILGLNADDDLAALDDLDQYLEKPHVPMPGTAPAIQPVAPVTQRREPASDFAKLESYSSLPGLTTTVSSNTTSGPNRKTSQNDVEGDIVESGRGIRVEQEKGEEEDDGLADFERWIEECEMKIE
jgi:hypothetical protein